MNPLDFSRIKDEAHPEDFLSEMKPFGDSSMMTLDYASGI